MIRSFLFSTICAALITLGVGFGMNDLFLKDLNWLWIFIPSFWTSWQIFSRIFRILDIVIGIAIVCAIVYLSKAGIITPWG